MPRLRYGLEIRNRSLTRALDQQIPIMVEIDHAAMIGRGASFDGRDIEFVSNDGLGNRSVLPFVLDHRSQWGASDTQIWLAIDGEIAANATDVDSYELQISPGLVLHEAYDPNLIFEVFDDFGDGEFSLNFVDRWAAVNLENASGTMSVGSGVLHVEKDPLQKGRLIGINSRSHFRLRSPVLEVSANVQDAGEALSCFTSRVAAFSEDGGNYLYAAGIVGEGGTYLQSYQGGLHTYKTEGKGKSAAAYRDYELRWEVRNLTFVQSGLQVAKDTNDATASAERFGLHLGIEMGSSCGRIQPVAVDYDWVLLRDSMDADPSVQVVEIQ